MFTRRPALTSLQYFKKGTEMKDISKSRFLITAKIRNREMKIYAC